MEVKSSADGEPFAVWGDYKVQIERTPVLMKTFQETVEQELRETPANVENGLRELRELLKKENELKVPVDDDDFLIKFLRPCKFYAVSALKKIQQHYKFRASHQKDYSRELVPASVKLPFQHSCLSILMPRDQLGRRILLIEAGERWDHRVVPLLEAFRGMQLAVEAALLEPATQAHGLVIVFDMKGLSLAQVMQFTPFYAKMTAEWIQDCVPIRLKGVHIINQPYVFNMVFALFKPFLREKLRSRIHFHGSNMQSLQKHVDGSCLRRRHGGTLPKEEVPGEVEWKILAHYEETFRLLDSYGYPKQ